MNDNGDLSTRLLAGITTDLDIPADKYQGGGRSLRGRRSMACYPRTGLGRLPQGSFRLGTVVRPFSREEYDVDLVALARAAPGTITQKRLKTLSGGDLRAYVAAMAHDASAPERLEEGRRCWTLLFGEAFHMDVLPAIVDPDGTESGILITDRDVSRWLPSDPIAYADWFWAVMADEFDERRVALAGELRASIEDVPRWRVKTTLQQTVQVLKRHRDVHFAERPNQKPASIIVSTLAARTYTGERDLYTATATAVDQMPSLIEHRNGVAWIPNPVQEQENFADRWQEDNTKERAFYTWLQKVASDLGVLRTERGDRQLESLTESFGDPARRAWDSIISPVTQADREMWRADAAAGTGDVIRPGERRIHGGDRRYA